MKQLIDNVVARLSAQVPALKYIGQDWGQMDYFDPGRPPVKFPCALVDIQSANYTNDGNLIQQGTATVVVSLYMIRISNNSAGAPDTQKANAAQIWQLLEDINKTLHGQRFLETGMGLLMRTSMRSQKRADGVWLKNIYYTVQFTDNTCAPVLTPVSGVSPHVTTDVL
jgi:hypothetical protein